MTEYRCWSADVGVQSYEAEKVEATCARAAAAEFIERVEARNLDYPIASGQEEALVKVATGVGGRDVQAFRVVGISRPAYGVLNA